MEFRFAPMTLESLDVLKTEVLCLSVFSDERPLRGAAGLVDWRLCGRLSELLVRGHLTGAFDQALLVPPPDQRLPAERVFCLGAGARAELTEARFRALTERMVSRVLSLRVRTAAIALPHASIPGLDPVRAIDLLLEQTLQCSERFDELVLIDTSDAQRVMEPRIDRARRRAEADV
jgi:hypothetical protein